MPGILKVFNKCLLLRDFFFLHACFLFIIQVSAQVSAQVFSSLLLPKVVLSQVSYYFVSVLLSMCHLMFWKTFLFNVNSARVRILSVWFIVVSSEPRIECGTYPKLQYLCSTNEWIKIHSVISSVWYIGRLLNGNILTLHVSHCGVDGIVEKAPSFSRFFIQLNEEKKTNKWEIAKRRGVFRMQSGLWGRSGRLGRALEKR